MNDGETIQNAALRETREETGLIPTKILAVYDGFDYTTDKKPKVRQVNFVVEVESGDVILSGEHDDFVWVDFGSIQSLKITSNMLACIKRALVIADSI